MCQFKFLIVEDDSPTLRQLKSLIGEDFPKSQIDDADTVAKGRHFLQAANSENTPYHAVILDFRLPQDMGDRADVDTSLYREAQRASHPRHPVLVAQITSYIEDKTVEEHIKETQLEKPNPNAFLVSKGESEWPARLVTKLRQFLYSRQVQRELNEIFGEPASPYWGRSRKRGAAISGGMTHRLATLCRMIEAHWEDLEEDLKERIHGILQVDESSDKPKVGLLLEDPWIQDSSRPSKNSP